MDDMQANTVPEPGTVILLGTGLLAVAAVGRRRFGARGENNVEDSEAS